MKNLIYPLLFIYAILAVLTIIFFNGTGDPGDSIYHFLFAKFAPAHLELFFDHWAKPVFVLLACPFAQFGFVGMKIFNAIVSLLTIFLTFRITQLLNIKNALLVAVIMIFTPLYYILTFSGLTEPLFALFVAVSLYLAVKHKYVATCLVLSFLPFVRSEGLIIIGAFGIYFILVKQWRFLPFLLFGSVIYSIAGYSVHHDLLWVFSKIPYARLSSQYGSGTPFHFVVQLLYVVGVPVYFLFWFGIISIILRTIKKTIDKEEQILIFLGFLLFFIAHSIFWYFGIFNSMGLKRVLISVMPMIAVISLQGYNFISEDLLKGKKIPKMAIQIVFVTLIILFPFTHNPAAIRWERDMMRSRDQQSAIGAADFIRQKKVANTKVLCGHPYVILLLNIDCFENHRRLGLTLEDINRMKTGDFVIWENWFAVVESNISKESLDNYPGLVNVYNSKAEAGGHEILYSIFEKK